MKKIIVIFTLFMFTLMPLTLDAALKLLKNKVSMEIDLKDIPREHKIRYKIFKKKCTQHHSLNRPIQAIKTGITPVTKSKFGKEEVKKYLIKMMRKPNSGVDRGSAKSIERLIFYLIDNKDKIHEIVE